MDPYLHPDNRAHLRRQTQQRANALRHQAFADAATWLVQLARRAAHKLRTLRRAGRTTTDSSLLEG